MVNVGVVGYGSMGAAIVGHLLGAGHEVRVFDLDSDRVKVARAGGVRLAVDVEELAGWSEVALILVGSEEGVRALVDDEGPFARTGEAIVCVLSTVSPSLLRRTRGLASAGRLVDAPVCRALEGAKTGTLLGVLSGPFEAIVRIRELFGVFCSDLWCVSERLGDAQVVKTINNVILWGAFMVTEEALEMARAEGIDIGNLKSTLATSSADSWALRHFDKASELRWSKKDMTIATNLADTLDGPFPLTRLVGGLVRSSKYLGHAT